MIRLDQLSKEISYALRHVPWEYELEIDEECWVSIGRLLEALHRTEQWKSISKADLNKMVEKQEKNAMKLKKVKLEHFMDILYLSRF